MLRDQERQIPPHMLDKFGQETSKVPLHPISLSQSEDSGIAATIKEKMQAPFATWLKALQDSLSGKRDSDSFAPLSATSQPGSISEKQYLGESKPRDTRRINSF